MSLQMLYFAIQTAVVRVPKRVDKNGAHPNPLLPSAARGIRYFQNKTPYCHYLKLRHLVSL